MFFAGAIYAVGVFDPSISATTPALAGIWASSMAVMTLISAPAMILAALYLANNSEDEQIQKTIKLRVLGSIGGLCFLGLSIGSFGVTKISKFLVCLGVAFQGIPFGACLLQPFPIRASMQML
eukprot:IDg15960t1